MDHETLIATCFPFAAFFALVCIAAFCGGVSVGVCVERKRNGKECCSVGVCVERKRSGKEC